MVLSDMIFAQEYLTPLNYNPYLMNYKISNDKTYNKSINQLKLPVVIDLANNYGFPSSRFLQIVLLLVIMNIHINHLQMVLLLLMF